jgi:PleD family two-component response regulator
MGVVLGNIRRHSGTLRIRSARDTGTTAEVFLPIGAHPALETIKSDVVSLREPNRGTVPVIDDDDLVRDLCKAYVELEGYTAVTASDGQDGLSIFNELAGRGTPVAAVVLDLVMPRMDGTRPYALSTHTCPSFDVPASMNMTD